MTNDVNEELFSSFLAIGQGSTLHILGRLLGKAVGLSVNILLTRTYGAALYGAFILATRVTQIGVIVAQAGASSALSRFLPGFNERSEISVFVGSVGVITLLLGLLLSVCFFFAAPLISSLTLGSEVFIGILRVFALVIPVNALANIAIQSFRGLEMPGYYIGTDQAVWPILRFIFVAGAVVLGVGIVGVTAATVLAWGTTLLVAVGLLVRVGVRPTPAVRRSLSRDYFSFSLPVTVSELAGFAYGSADVLILGYLVADSTGVGIYAAAAALSSLLALPATGMNQLFPPAIARLYGEGNAEVVEEIYKLIARVALTISALTAALMIAYSESLLSIFGPEFTAGTRMLYVLLIGRITVAIFGYGDKVLLMTDHQYLHSINKLATGAYSIIATYLFVVLFGPIGAAIGFSSTIVISGGVETYLAWRTEGLSPISVWLLTPVVGGGSALVTMVYLRQVVTGVPKFFIPPVGVVVFALILAGLGFREDDRRVMQYVYETAINRLH